MQTHVMDLMAGVSGHNYVNGQYRLSAGARRPVIDPATEQPTAEFALSTPGEVDEAVAASRRAQREWWALSALERAGALHQVADQLLALAPVIGECLTREMGKPFRESNWEGGASASSFRYYAEIARHEQGRLAGSAIAGQMHFTLKEPLGVVVSIVPFNFPVLLFGWQAAASLAAGNAIIVKPSDLTPLTLLVAM
ncbi:MAG: aldehyde dehydrogenase family protein, partial [Ilumatobacteraceae bacterium]